MNTIFFLVKFFNNPNYADDFVHGRVFSRRLADFKKNENDDNSGRIDRNEGTTAWLQPGKGQLTLNGMHVSDDLAGPVQIQEDWLNHLHVFCAHAGHSGELDLSNLSNNNSQALQQELTIDDRCLSLGSHAVIVMDVPGFIKRMESYAREAGYQIARKLVKYYDPETFHGHFRDVESVFWKQDQYSFQREFRFVISSRSWGECPLVMDIGDIRDITLQLESTELNGKNFLGGKIDFVRHEREKRV